MMQRRTFLGLCATGVLLAGCGGSSEDFVVTGGSAASADPFEVPVLANASIDTTMAFGAGGDIFSASFSSAMVTRYSPQGDLVYQVSLKGRGAGQLDTPGSLAADRQGQLWITDVGAGRVLILDPGGNPLGEFGQGDLLVPQDILVTENRVFVSDGLNRRVAIFDLQGQPSGEIRHARLSFPRGLALDNEGRLHVADPASGEIGLYSQAGEFLGVYGASSTVYFRGVAVRSGDGLIAIADPVDGDVEFYSQDFQVVGSTRPPVLPRDVQFGPDGRLYVNGPSRTEGA